MVLGVRANALRDVRVECARIAGVFLFATIATAGASGTITDTVRVQQWATGSLDGKWVYIHRGTGIGQSRQITTHAASGVLNVTHNWATTPDNTSEFLVLSISGTDIDVAIDAAIARYAERCAIPMSNHYLGVDNLFNDPDSIGDINSDGTGQNWQMDKWTTANAPDDWTLTNTNSDEEDSTLAYARHRRTLKLANAGASAASAVLAVGTRMKWGGHQLRAVAMAHAADADRLTLRINDGATQTNGTVAHTGDSLFELLEVPYVTVNPTTALDASARISSGGAITVYLQNLMLVADEHFQEYHLPVGFTRIEEIYFEQTWPGNYGKFGPEPVDFDAWDVRQGGRTNVLQRPNSVLGQDSFLHPRLWLDLALVAPPTPARILIEGVGFPNLIASVASNLNGPGTTTYYEDMQPIAAVPLIQAAAALAIVKGQHQNARRVNPREIEREIQGRGGLLAQYTTRAPSRSRKVRQW